MKGLEVLNEVRSICSKLSEVVEHVDKFGHISFRIKDKPFVIMSEELEKGSISIKSDKVTQEILLQQDRFYKTPYIGHHGWVSILITEKMDWSDIEDLIREAYFRTAPKSILKKV